jgi:hypothetical protein
MKIRELFESKSAPKPRNFVAKNAKSAGAGAHKDKKQAVKQGKVKHKNKELQNEDVDQINEKAKSKAQQKFMGMVYAAKKGEKPASPKVAKVAKGMSKKSAKDYAATKHKGKPEHVKETATAGATSAGNVSVGAVYKNKPGKTYKNKDGTAKNALDVKGANLLSGGSIKR